MKKLGTVENVIHDGTAILRASEAPEPGTLVFDSRGAEVGRVARVFGPVSGPYVSLKPRADTDALKLVGATLYTGDSEPARRNLPSRGGTHRPRVRDHAHGSRDRRPEKNRGVKGKWQRKGNPRKR